MPRRKRLARWKVSASAAALLLLAIAVIAAPHWEMARPYFSATGIDVSRHNGEVNWRQVAKADVSFTFIKATEGNSFSDKNFAANWQGAKDAGLIVGAYHFFTQCHTGEVQAKFFLSKLPQEQGMLPPVIDAEQMEPCKYFKSDLDPATEIKNFLDTVESAIGCRPMIYTNREFDRTFLSGKLSGEKFWPNSTFWPPSIRKGDWLFWQYSVTARRPGIETDVDLNVFRGSKADLEDYVKTVGCFK